MLRWRSIGLGSSRRAAGASIQAMTPSTSGSTRGLSSPSVLSASTSAHSSNRAGAWGRCRTAWRCQHSMHPAPARVTACSVTPSAAAPSSDAESAASFAAKGPEGVGAALQQATSTGAVPPHGLPQPPSTLPAEQLQRLDPGQLAATLQGVATLAADAVDEQWYRSALAATQTHITHTLGEDDVPQLAALLWAVSELPCSEAASPDAAWFTAVEARLLSCIREGSCFAQDLAACLAALADLGYKPSHDAAQALAKEVQLQLTEFLSDFTARDIARVVAGIVGLELSGSLTADFSPRLMKAVYSKVWTIEDKAAVDFALSQLDAENKSMHYDPRWTHEELTWLPRRERDKRRIMAETWERSQWGGWAGRR